VESLRQRALRKLVLLLDAALVVASMVLALLIHGQLRELAPIIKKLPDPSQYITLVYLAIPLWLALIALLGMHRVLERPATRGELLVDLLKLHLLGLVGLSIIIYLAQATINRSLMAIFFGCSFVLLFFERAGLGLWVRYQHRRGMGRLRLLLVGDPGPEMEHFVLEATARPFPPRLLGYLRAGAGAGGEGQPPGAELPPLLGRAAELEQQLHELAVDRVLFFPPLNRPADAAELLTACETLGVPADFAIEIHNPFAAPPRLQRLYAQPFISLETAPKRPEALAIKHALDVLLAALGLVLLSPVLLLTSLAILLSMGRPVLFSQRRIGLHGRRFRIHKFRTMVQGAEQQRDGLLGVNEMSGPVFKSADDPRVTRLGRLLRRTSIDELPQLLNVVRGEMSLVGPRPLPEGEQREIRGWRRRRLSMKPGITGLWQVSGRNTVDFEEWMKLDLRYVDHWSLTLDLRILLRTLPAVLSSRGAR
jgi:exopolysaccharide biosynthesis polyprenyl glycosylphosphotransferase